MIFRSFRRTDQAGTIGALYGAIVAQARHPTFYRCYQVPDTIDGRFDSSMCGKRSTSRRRKTALISSPPRSLFPVRIL
jgi:hypothetical protein